MQTGGVMKKIILMCLFGLMFSQTELTTRLYTIDLDMSGGEYLSIDMEEITGYDLSSAIINVVSLENNTNDNINLSYGCDVVEENQLLSSSSLLILSPVKTIVYLANQNCFMRNTSNNSIFSSSLSIQITAEFPIEDTGYIEEGFDFCLHSGQNLVSFPCENSVSVETALPELAQAEITSIIGEGVASTNINGQFLGSLQNFSPGAGYWFKSNSSMCFNYTCSE